MNQLTARGRTTQSASKVTFEATTGSKLRIETPGGGGWGREKGKWQRAKGKSNGRNFLKSRFEPSQGHPANGYQSGRGGDEQAQQISICFVAER